MEGNVDVKKGGKWMESKKEQKRSRSFELKKRVKMRVKNGGMIR